MLWERVYSDIPRWWLHPWSVGPFNNLLFAHYKTCHHHHTVKCSGGGVQRVWVRLWAEPFLRTLEGSGETEVRERVYISDVLPAALLQGSGRLTGQLSELRVCDSARNNSISIKLPLQMYYSTILYCKKDVIIDTRTGFVTV